MAGKSYRDLMAWQKAMKLVTEIYAKTEGFPKTETFGLSAQMRRAAVSVPSNIAEGAGRGSNPDFSRLCWFSMGSCNELESQLLLARDVKFIKENVHLRFENDLSNVRQMLTRFVQSLHDSQ